MKKMKLQNNPHTKSTLVHTNTNNTQLKQVTYQKYNLLRKLIFTEGPNLRSQKPWKHSATQGYAQLPTDIVQQSEITFC